MTQVMGTQVMLEEADEAYKTFVEKFKPKKTTDDCYTPKNIYEAVSGWVAEEYGAERGKFVRPFWPGADYRLREYADGEIVVDNPPFSILSEIVRFYTARGIKFFLFGPALTIIAGYRPGTGVCYVCTGENVTFENGAQVSISFVTNMEKDGTLVRSAPELVRRIREENRKNEKQQKKQLPKYTYPDAVITAARVQYYSQHATEYRVKEKECLFIRAMDEQRKEGKSLFGGGFLLSEKAAAEKAAAEKAAAEKAAAEKAAATCWRLSEREKEMQRGLGE
ncbi:MAG: hypothetical protein IKI84_04970 [Clostridia bacterium]|nr:hypothetical protein [Clostridia bacterium]